MEPRSGQAGRRGVLEVISISLECCYSREGVETTTTTITRWLEMVRPRLVQIISQDLAGDLTGWNFVT